MRNYLSMGLLLIAATPTLAQSGGPRLAAYESLSVAQPTRQVTFAKRAAQLDDRIEQTLEASLELHSSVRRGQETTETKSREITSSQDRVIIAREIVDGRTVGADVHFSKYLRSANGESEQPPVVGKTYRCRRMEDQTLQITRVDGSFAGPDEFELVSESMQALGKPNPLADFLASRTIEVGQSIEAPREVGDALLSDDGALGSVSKFTITLREVDVATGVAKFDVQLESVGERATQMKLMLTGTLDIEPATCRTRSLELNGPLGMATTTGSYSAAKTTYVRGKLNMQMKADYADK